MNEPALLPVVATSSHSLPEDIRNHTVSAYSGWRQELHDFWSFLKKPVRGPAVSLPLHQGWRRILLLLGVQLIVVILVTLPFNTLLDNWAGIENRNKEWNGYRLAFMIVLAPLLEEFIFRAGLRKATYSLLIGPLIVCASLDIGIIVLVLAVLLMLLALAGWLRLRWMQSPAGIRFARGRAFIHRYSYIFWMYAIGFGLVHIRNFYSSTGRDYLLVLAISSQLSCGIVCGYLRLRQGLRSSIALHALFNSTLVAVAFVAESLLE